MWRCTAAPPVCTAKGRQSCRARIHNFEEQRCTAPEQCSWYGPRPPNRMAHADELHRQINTREHRATELPGESSARPSVEKQSTSLS